MGKKDFLDILRQSLEGEVNSNILEQNIRFYNDYISSNSVKSEAEILDELGDPRLIAKTIIETENATNHTETNRWNNYGNHSNRRDYDDYNGNKDYHSSSNNKIFHLKWYHMVAMIFILLFLLFIVIRIGWMLIRLFFIFFAPIIFIVLILVVFRKR